MTGGAAVTVVAVVVALAIAAGGNGIAPPSTPRPTITPEPDDPVTTTLVFGTREAQRESRKTAVWMTLLSYDTEEKEGAVVYIPAHTAVEIPGRGLQGLGDALATGGVPLLLVGTENLLGVKIDRYVELSDRDARVLFDVIGPLSVDIPADVRISAGKKRTRLLFTAGLTQLTPRFMVRLLYTIGLEGDDVELGGRHLAFWDALLEAFHSEPANLGRAVRGAGPALAESDVEASEHAVFFEVLSGLEPTELTITTIPVEQVSVGGTELYATDEDELQSFIPETLGAVASVGDEVRVQVLNGNGVPGIGQEVAERLIGRGYRVILSGNARRLNYKTTKIITYDRSAAGIDLAEQTKEILGVGEVQISGIEQGIVDLTIVVGKDFLRTL